MSTEKCKSKYYFDYLTKVREFEIVDKNIMKVKIPSGYGKTLMSDYHSYMDSLTTDQEKQVLNAVFNFCWKINPTDTGFIIRFLGGGYSSGNNVKECIEQHLNSLLNACSLLS